MLFFDPLYLILAAPGVLFAAWAAARTRSTYRRYSRISARTRLTGAQVARRLLDADRLTDVSIERIPGELTDHYDPRGKVLRLSAAVHDGTSLAAIGVAAHEMGHAIQDADAYKPLVARQAFVPVAAFASRAWVWLFFLGAVLAANPMLGRGLQLAALACLVAYALFAILTLPVEFDASRRALLVLESSRTLEAEEVAGARRVLSAAALTYVASAVQAVLMVIWLVLRSQRR
jgi:hypothetical protein